LAAALAELETRAATLTESEAAKRRIAIGIVVRTLTRLREDAAADRRRLEGENAGLRCHVDTAAARIADLESHERARTETLAELRRAIGVITKDLAAERTLRRMQGPHGARTPSRFARAHDRQLAQAIAARGLNASSPPKELGHDA
jgi:hypothetical protein